MPSKFCFTVAFKFVPSLIISIACSFPSTPVTMTSSRPASWSAFVAPIAGSSHAANTAVMESFSGFAVKRFATMSCASLIGCSAGTCCSDVRILFDNVIKCLTALYNTRMRSVGQGDHGSLSAHQIVK